MISSVDVGPLVLITKHDNGFIEIRLNRPKKYNSLDADMLRSIRDCLDENIPSCRGVILCAVEGRAFCAGADVKYVASLSPQTERIEFLALEYGVHQRLLEAHAKHAIPVVAVADGIVMGAGAGLWMAASVRVATDKTLFSMPECNIGLLPDAGKPNP